MTNIFYNKLKVDTIILVRAPIEKLIYKLIEAKIVKRNSNKILIPQSLGHLTPMIHYEIVSYFNTKINCLLLLICLLFWLFGLYDY